MEISIEVLEAHLGVSHRDILKAALDNESAISDKYLQSFNLDYPSLRQVHYSPAIFEITDFISSSICEKYINLALNGSGKQQLSQTFGSSLVKRTSTTWNMDNIYMQELHEVVRQLTGVTSERYESTQIVRYTPGQQYTFHLDALPHNIAASSSQGNRLATLLVYLNTPECGGNTCFRDLNLEIIPVIGKALLFFPCFSNGEPDVRTIHAGSVAEDVKYIAQIWIRES
jgi:hypothetical protein